MEHGIPIGMMGWGCGNDAIRPASAWGLHIAATTSQSDASTHGCSRDMSMSALNSLVAAIFMKSKDKRVRKLTLPAHDAQSRPRELLAILEISRHGYQHRRAHHRRQIRRTPCCGAREPVTSLSPHLQPLSGSSEATMIVIPPPRCLPPHRPPPGCYPCRQSGC